MDDLETITGYDFFSDLPDEIEKELEKRKDDRFIGVPNVTAPLLANEESQSIFLSPSWVSKDFSVGQNSSDRVIFSEKLGVNISSLKVTSPGGDSFSLNDDALEISSLNRAIGEGNVSQVSTSKRSIVQDTPVNIGHVETGIIKVDSSQVRAFESNFFNTGSFEVDPFQIGMVNDAAKQVSIRQISSAQIDAGHIDILQNTPTPIDSSKVSFSGVESFPQFLSIHKPINLSKLEINHRKNLSKSIFESLDVEIQISDLAQGQLAEATITHFDTKGYPFESTPKATPLKAPSLLTMTPTASAGSSIPPPGNPANSVPKTQHTDSKLSKNLLPTAATTY